MVFLAGIYFTPWGISPFLNFLDDISAIQIWIFHLFQLFWGGSFFLQERNPAFKRRSHQREKDDGSLIDLKGGDIKSDRVVVFAWIFACLCVVLCQSKLL